MKKLKVRFFIKGDKKNQNGEIAIYGRIYVGSKKTSFSTSKYIDRERWKKTNQLRDMLRIHKEISLKEYLNSIKLSIEDSYNELLRNNSIDKNKITPSYVKSYFLNGNCEDKITLLEIVNIHNDYFKKQVYKGDRAEGSLEKYERMGKVIKEFLQLKYNLDDIDFDEIDRKFVYSLDEYLRFERVHINKKGVANNTTVKYIRNISSIISYCIKLGIVNHNPFSIYNQSLEEVKTVFLTHDELNRIENKSFENRRLDVVKDIFLFSCYTSYAPVDVMNLRQNNYTLDEDLDNWLETKRQKTKVETNVLVIPPLKRIIDKYKNDPECIEENRLVPKRSNSNMNAYLKEIADICGIDKNLTWYVGRHTFATTVALANDIPMEIISQIMGHKRITQTQHYAKLTKGSVKKHMQKLNDTFD